MCQIYIDGREEHLCPLGETITKTHMNTHTNSYKAAPSRRDSPVIKTLRRAFQGMPSVLSLLKDIRTRILKMDMMEWGMRIFQIPGKYFVN